MRRQGAMMAMIMKYLLDFYEWADDCHICKRCERLKFVDPACYENTTQDVNACLFARQRTTQKKDNGAGYWITDCSGFIPRSLTEQVYLEECIRQAINEG